MVRTEPINPVYESTLEKLVFITIIKYKYYENKLIWIWKASASFKANKNNWSRFKQLLLELPHKHHLRLQHHARLFIHRPLHLHNQPAHVFCRSSAEVYNEIGMLFRHLRLPPRRALEPALLNQFSSRCVWRIFKNASTVGQI